MLLKLPRPMRMEVLLYCQSRAGSGIGDLACALKEQFVRAARSRLVPQFCCSCVGPASEGPRAMGGCCALPWRCQGFCYGGLCKPSFSCLFLPGYGAAQQLRLFICLQGHHD